MMTNLSVILPQVIISPHPFQNGFNTQYKIALINNKQHLTGEQTRRLETFCNTRVARLDLLIFFIYLALPNSCIMRVKREMD